LSTEPLGHRILDRADLSSFLPNTGYEEADGPKGYVRATSNGRELAPAVENTFSQRRSEEIHLHSRSDWMGLSPWSGSTAKRIFDCTCVLLSLPVLLPLMLAIGAAVRLASAGPVFFLQERVGRNGRIFTIFKFRTMIHVADAAHNPITTSDNQRFTPVGPFLRRWKLDELPQLLNVLIGDMSLIGPRPKMPEHVLFDLPCRPGITGMATTVFACEDRILDCVAKDELDAYFHSVVLPAKRRLDVEYMRRATFLSDLRLLVNSVLRRWDTTALDELIVATAFEANEKKVSFGASKPARTTMHPPHRLGADRNVEAQRVSVG
jgi:lipopolysaccharide/colanic/teichoic acid biosynthesis glycosyltransferase